MIRILAALLALSAPAFAQDDMPPIDRDLWQAMSQAFGNISMPLTAHQQVQEIMQGAERQAAQRKSQRDAEVRAKQDQK